MMSQIGELAGRVWQYLSENPHSSVRQIGRSLGASNGLLYMSVGWLAREDKLIFTGEGTRTKVALK